MEGFVKVQSRLTAAVLEPWWFPSVCQGRTCRSGHVPPPQPAARKLGDIGAAPVLDIGHLTGAGDRPRLGYDKGFWLCRAGLQGAGD